MLCRAVQDFDLLIRRCRDTYRDGRGLIIPLTDADLDRLLDEKMLNEDARPEDILLADRLRQIVMA